MELNRRQIIPTTVSIPLFVGYGFAISLVWRRGFGQDFPGRCFLMLATYISNFVKFGVMVQKL